MACSVGGVGALSALPAQARTVVAAGWRQLPRRVRLRRWRSVDPFNRAVLAAGAEPVVTARMRLGHRLRLDLRSGSEWFAYYTREFDDRRITAARRLLHAPRSVAVDAGANIGLWTVPLARHLAEFGGHVVAVEPIPANAARLRENLRLNGLEVVVDVHEVAVSDRAGTAELSLREDFRDGAATGNAAIVIDDGTDTAFRTVVVPTVPLDTLLAGAPRVDFVKADLEGHEDRFLAGAAGTLARCRPVVVCEWNRVYYARRDIDPTAAVAGLLDSLDYRCLRHTPGGWSVSRDMFSPHPLDDLVLTPVERVADVTAVLGPW